MADRDININVRMNLVGDQAAQQAGDQVNTDGGTVHQPASAVHEAQTRPDASQRRSSSVEVGEAEDSLKSVKAQYARVASSLKTWSQKLAQRLEVIDRAFARGIIETSTEWEEMRNLAISRSRESAERAMRRARVQTESAKSKDTAAMDRDVRIEREKNLRDAQDARKRSRQEELAKAGLVGAVEQSLAKEPDDARRNQQAEDAKFRAQQILGGVARGNPATEEQLAQVERWKKEGFVPSEVHQGIKTGTKQIRAATQKIEREDYAYEEGVFKRRDAATRAAEKRLGRHLTPEEKRSEEITQLQQDFQNKLISGPQFDKSSQRVNQTYDDKRTKQQTADLEKYQRAIQGIEVEQAQMERSLSYVGMAAQQVGRSFAYLGVSGEESTQKLLQGIVKIEAAFGLFRGLTLGASSVHRIGVSLSRESIRMREVDKLWASQVATHGEAGAKLIGREAIEAAAAAKAAQMIPDKPAMSWLSKLLTPGGAATAGVIGATAAGGLGLGTLYSKIPDWMFPSSALGKPLPSMTDRVLPFAGVQGLRTAGAWERRRRGYEAARQQAVETDPQYAMQFTSFQRNLTIGQTQAAIDVRQGAIGSIPSSDSMYRQAELARVDLHAQEARNLQATKALRMAQIGVTEVETGRQAAIESQRLREDKIKELQARQAKSSYGYGPGGMSFQASTTIAEGRTLAGLQNQPASVSPAVNAYEDALKRRAAAEQEMVQNIERTKDAQNRLAQAEAELARHVRSMITQAHRGYTNEARGMYQTLEQRRDMRGGMNIGKRAMLGVALNMVRSNIDPDVMPPEMKELIHSGAGGERARLELQARERKKQDEWLDATGNRDYVEGGEKNQIKFKDRAAGAAAGTVPATGTETIPGQREIVAKLDEKAFAAVVEQEQQMVTLLRSIDMSMRQFDMFRVLFGQGEAAANAPAGNKPQAGVNWSQQRILGMS